MTELPIWLEDQLYKEVWVAQMMSADYHKRTFITIDNAMKGCVSVQSFRYTTGQSRYWSEKARQALFQLIGDGTPESDLDPAECEAF